MFGWTIKVTPFYLVVQSAFTWGVNGEQTSGLSASTPYVLPALHAQHEQPEAAYGATGATGTCLRVSLEHSWSRTHSIDFFASPQTLSCSDTTDHLSSLEGPPEAS